MATDENDGKIMAPAAWKPSARPTSASGSRPCWKPALQRGIAMKEYLVEKQSSPERVFFGTTQPGAIDAEWAPRAELNLLTN